MSTNDLFAEDDAVLDESDDSFIADSESESASSMASVKGAKDENQDEYDFLFGFEEAPKEEKKKSKKTASTWQKELDRRLKEAGAQYKDFEDVESEVAFNVSQIAYHFERRQGVESEMLSLFSGLLTRERFNVEPTPAPNTEKPPKVDLPETDRAMEKMMKKLIRQTFRGRAPEGRFGGFSKAPEDSKKTASSHKVSTVTTIGKDALSNLQDLNILLSREREGDYVELDGVPLYKHTRYATLYVLEGNFISSYILPLCSKLLREANNAEYDTQALTQEIVYLLYQLSQPPSESWYNYWTEAHPHYRDLAKSSEYNQDPQVATELKRRARIVWKYLNGMIMFRSALQSADLWTLIGEFRLNMENFERAGYQTAEQKKHMEYLVDLQNNLANERDSLLSEEKGDDDEEEERVRLGRLKKDQSASDARKKRIQEIRQQLYNVNDELAKERENHIIAQQQTKVHIKTVRLFIMHILTVPGDGLRFLGLLQESGLLSLLKNEIISCFESCKRGFTVSTDGSIMAHASYLSEQQRESMWEYVRLVHSLLVCVDIGRFLSLVYAGIKPEEMKDNEEIMRSGDDSIYQKVEDESFLDLMRINPKLARLTLRGSAQAGKFVINERLGGRRNYGDYDQWFRFPALPHLQTPFEVMSGFSTRNDIHPFSGSLMKALQSELHSLIGIDAEFEHCHWTEGENGKPLYYELGLVLSLCLGDLAREAEDRYYKPSDYQVVLDIHTMVVTYYRCLYIYMKEVCRLERRTPQPEAYVLLALRRYVGADSLCSRVSCSYLWHLIRKQSMSKSSHIGATSALRALYSDLCLMDMFKDVNDNLPVLRICQETLTSYFMGDIRAIIFWVLRYFKPLSHSIDLFAFALSSLHMLKKVLSKIGAVSFTQENVHSDSLRYDSDSESSDDGKSATKTIVVTPEAVFTSRNRKTVNDDIIFNGRVVYNCIYMLANFTTNTVHMNDLLVSHLETVPLPMLYDVKYFYVFQDIMNNKRVWQNARWKWVGDFCAHVLESFFDSWLGRGNRFLPVELFFNKCSPSTKGPFRPCAPENIIPLSRGYARCDLLNEMLRRPEASVYEVSKEMRGGDPGGAWDPDEDAALLQYHKQFMFLADPVSYIAELLGRRTADVVKRLQELRVTSEEPGTAGGATRFELRQLIRKLVIEFADEAIKVCAELHENISESLEMQKLGGEESLCEVMEPLSASSGLLASANFRDLLKCLGISQSWLLPKDTTSILLLMDVLGDPNNYLDIGKDTSKRHAQPEEPSATTAYQVPQVVTSRDIAKFILELYRSLDRNKESLQLDEVLVRAASLVESAAIIGTAETLFEGLPQSEDVIEQLSRLLQVFNISVITPTLVCSGITDEAAVMDRLKVAMNLSKLAADRLEDIVSADIRQPVMPTERFITTSSLNDVVMDDPFEHHLDLNAPISLNTTKSKADSKRETKPKATKDRGVSKGKLKRPGMKAGTIDPSIQPVIDELWKRLSKGETTINAADLMGAASFDDWEDAFANIRNVCKSWGAEEESVGDALWLNWTPGSVKEALSAMPRDKKQNGVTTSEVRLGVRCLITEKPRDFRAFERLEVDRNLVASLYTESLRLAQEGQLENTVKSREDLKQLIEQ